MRENMTGEGQLGMRDGRQKQISQQSLPSVSHVMGPLPGAYHNSSSYVSPQSSQPPTPHHSSSINPSPLAPSLSSGPVRMIAIGQRNRSPHSLSKNMPAAGPVGFARPSNPAALVHNSQMHVISSTQYSNVEPERMQPATNAMQQKNHPGQLTPKEKYRQLKSRFKYLVYENECYQEELRNFQRKLLKLSRDKNFLLDRLQPYEMLSNSSDESDSNSVKTVEEKPKVPKKKAKPSVARRRLPMQRSKPMFLSEVRMKEIKTEVNEMQQLTEQNISNLIDQNKIINGTIDYNSAPGSVESLTHISNSDDIRREA